MPKAELSELLFILIMFIVVTVITVASIFLFVRQFNREKKATHEARTKKEVENKNDQP